MAFSLFIQNFKINPSSEQTRQNDKRKTLRDNTMYVQIANHNARKKPNPRPMAMARVKVPHLSPSYPIVSKSPTYPKDNFEYCYLF
jgi:hypothetical protein